MFPDVFLGKKWCIKTRVSFEVIFFQKGDLKWSSFMIINTLIALLSQQTSLPCCEANETTIIWSIYEPFLSNHSFWRIFMLQVWLLVPVKHDRYESEQVYHSATSILTFHTVSASKPDQKKSREHPWGLLRIVNFGMKMVLQNAAPFFPFLSPMFIYVHWDFQKQKKRLKECGSISPGKKNNIISQQLHHLLPTYVPTPKTHFREKIHLALGRQKAKAKRARSRLEHCPSSGWLGFSMTKTTGEVQRCCPTEIGCTPSTGTLQFSPVYRSGVF